jgi:hypothetical protein
LCLIHYAGAYFGPQRFVILPKPHSGAGIRL